MAKDKDNVNGWIVYYVDTGSLPPEQAKKHVEEKEHEIRFKRVPSEYDVVVIGGRNVVDHIEVLEFPARS